MSTLTTLSLALSLLVLSSSPLAASEHAGKPAMRSSAPSHVDAPGDADKGHPVRVRETDRHHADAHEMININTADVKSLMSLTGVGRKVAERIVEYRDTHGPFRNADEIKKVEGVGNGVWERNRERIVVK
jgi:competence protein ComEA